MNTIVPYQNDCVQMKMIFRTRVLYNSFPLNKLVLQKKGEWTIEYFY